MKKLTKTAKTLDVIAKVLFWVLAVGGAIAVVVSIAFAIADDAVFADATASVTLGQATFHLAETPSSDVVRAQFLTGAVFVAAAVVITCIGIGYVRNILKPMVEERPFDGSVHKNMKKLAWLSLIGGGIISVFGVICEAIMMISYDWQSLFSDAVTGMDVELKLDMTFVVMFAIIYLLACVFQYGEQLQIESDETL